jgi:hypothetical protein
MLLLLLVVAAANSRLGLATLQPVKQRQQLQMRHPWM